MLVRARAFVGMKTSRNVMRRGAKEGEKVMVQKLAKVEGYGVPATQSREILDLPEILQHGIDHLESLVNLFTDFGASEYDLAADENEKHDLRLDHAID